MLSAAAPTGSRPSFCTTSPCSPQIDAGRSESAAQLSRLKTLLKMGRPDTSSGGSTGAAKGTNPPETRELLQGSTRKLWQGTKSITNHRKDVNRAVIQGGSLPGNLDSIRPTQQRHRPEGPPVFRRPCPPRDTCWFPGLGGT